MTKSKPYKMCPICGKHAQHRRSRIKKFVQIFCAACGEFRIDAEAEAYLQDNPVRSESKYIASFRLRWIRQSGLIIDEAIAQRLVRGSTKPPPLDDQDRRIFTWIIYQDGSKRKSDLAYTESVEGWTSILGFAEQRASLELIESLEKRGLIECKKSTNAISIKITEKGQAFYSKREVKQVESAEISGIKSLYLAEMTIENFKCFPTRQKIKFLNESGKIARWTVIIGDNGVGKTTLLQLCCGLFPVKRARTGQPSSDFQTTFEYHNYYSSINDYICAPDRKSSVQMRLCSGGQIEKSCDRYVEFGIDSNRHDLIFTELGAEFDTYRVGHHSKSHFEFYVGDQHILGDLPLIAAYGAGRRISRSTDGLRDEYNPTASLFDPDVSLRDATSWLLKTDYSSRFESDIRELSQLRLKVMKEAMVSLLPMVTEVNVEPPSHEIREPRILFTTSLGKVKYEDLSFGYKNVVTLILDIAQNFFDHYPDSEDPFSEPAIVIIDEIDLHLHPKWQRIIMSRLEELLPATQFIVSTHSPLIVQGIEKGNVSVIATAEEGLIIKNESDAVSRWRADQILTSELFGLASARSVETEELLQERRRILRKPGINKRDEHRLSEIEAQLGSYPVSENPSDDEALDLLKSILLQK